MKICVAQTQPFKGDIQRNIENHKKILAIAISYKADIIIFPELSVTGYEPNLAKELALHPDDHRLNVFQEISDAHTITIGVGVPTINNLGICITLILFQPHQLKQLYSKKYLHPDEEEFFCSGQNFTSLLINNTKPALAICYEIFVPEHLENVSVSGAEIYIASVAKSLGGIDKALQRLSDIARQCSMTVVMSNFIGESDGLKNAGKSSIWDSKGFMIGQLDDTHEGFLILDTLTQELIKKTI
jgi:predicted amidohydrolase